MRSSAPSRPCSCGELRGPRTSASTRAVARATSARSVFALPPSTASSSALIATASGDEARRRSPSTISSCPISGCVSSALRADDAVARRPRPRPRAARTRRRAGRGRAAPVPAAPAAAAAAPSRVDARRHLDDVVVGQPGERAVVAHVDDVHGAVAGDERARRARPPPRCRTRRRAARAAPASRSAPGRGTARAARARSRRPSARAASPTRCSASTRVVRVEVVQVVGRDRAELVEQRAAAARARRRARRRARPAAPAARRAPSSRTARIQVRWLRPDLVDDDALGLDAEQPRERALEPDRHVAEADGAVPGVEQRAGDDPDRVREVDDPGAAAPRARAPARRSRARPGRCAWPWRSRLRRSSPGRCSRRRAARSRRQPRRLAADADLEQHEVGAVERASRSPVSSSSPLVALRGEHPRGQAADDLAALGVDVVQRELAIDVELAREPRDELRRVRRAAADDGELHPFTPVSVTPSTNAFWARKKSDDHGRHHEQRRRHRQVPLHLVQRAELRRPIDSTQWCGFSPT